MERDREIGRMQMKMGDVSRRRRESSEQDKYAKHSPSTENWQTQLGSGEVASVQSHKFHLL